MVEEQIEYQLLFKRSVWYVKDLQAYYKAIGDPHSYNTCLKTIRKAREQYDGKVLLSPNAAKRDSVLALLGTTAGREIEIWHINI